LALLRLLSEVWARNLALEQHGDRFDRALASRDPQTTLFAFAKKPVSTTG